MGDNESSSMDEAAMGPEVAGRMCEWSMREFERRARMCIQREQEKPLPDNDLIAVLCNAVRLCREHTDRMTAVLNRAFSEIQNKAGKPNERS